MIAWTMPDALELLTTRRSFKAVELAGPVPSATEIDTLLTVASRVPDHGKLAPWRFIVFEGEARRSAGEAIAAAFRAKYPDARAEHIEAERERLVRAPLVIAVVSRAGPHVKIPEWEQVLSAGAAAMSLVIESRHRRMRRSQLPAIRPRSPLLSSRRGVRPEDSRKGRADAANPTGLFGGDIGFSSADV
jgi:nitroreductase